MISLATLDLRHLIKLADADDNTEIECLGDLGLSEDALERMTMYIGAMMTGDTVQVGDAVYLLVKRFGVMGEETAPYRLYPDGIGEGVTISVMVTEWAYLWFDAAPPILMRQ